MGKLSVAMTGITENALLEHLVRSDRQEDLCFAFWRSSSGHERATALVQAPLLPEAGERHVHGNASFEAGYLLRAVRQAAEQGAGVAFLHSHPLGRGWQGMSAEDRMAEARIANLTRETTGYPLLGLTLAGSDMTWSARLWDRGAGKAIQPSWCETVRVFGSGLRVSFNDAVVPAPAVQETQLRTVHAWGERTQSTIARLSVLVVGAGSVGMVIADALARTGVRRIGVLDFDTVELVNLDRLRGATRLDARLRRSKAFVARRLLAEASTAAEPIHDVRELSVCEPEGLSRLLDFDVVFSCVDRPWARHVLNTVAYADIIPIIDGGLRVFANADGSLRNAYWRSTVAGPGRPCLACLGQYDPGLVQVERDGSLDDPSYIANLPPGSPARHRENVAAFAASVAAALLEQFVSLVAQPSGVGGPGPLRFNLRDHSLEREAVACDAHCPYQSSSGCGDGRLDPTGRHVAAERARLGRRSVAPSIRFGRIVDGALWRCRQALAR